MAQCSPWAGEKLCPDLKKEGARGKSEQSLRIPKANDLSYVTGKFLLLMQTVTSTTKCACTLAGTAGDLQASAPNPSSDRRARDKVRYRLPPHVSQKLTEKLFFPTILESLFFLSSGDG